MLHSSRNWMIARMAQWYGRKAAIAGWSFLGILAGLIVAVWALWRLTGWWLDRPRVRAFLFSAQRA